ncbi:IS1595 family transposase [Rhodanobacter sp. C01]|uniref:IS1595 family transposase n=1 Tax=Rhodanobacter sp. C01 TaxID=1945856 RepID=UPI0009846A5B|nr:IS1595 family transposase [Rhodanobacter sp. C01]
MAKKSCNSMRGAARRDFARQVQYFTEDEAEQMLAEFRWLSPDQQICPSCGVLDHHYRIASRRQWRCRHVGCGHTFSVTSGTRFDSHKISFRKIIRLLIHAEASPKGSTLVATSNAVCMVEKCSQQNLMKIREAIMDNADSPGQLKLSGTIHVDGIHVCGKFRRSNRRMKATSGSVLAVHGTTEVKRRIRSINPQSKGNQRRAKNKRVAIAMVEVDSQQGGARRVVVAMCRSENASDVMTLAQQYIEPGSRVFTDENPAYNGLGSCFEHFVVNHSVEYSTPEGVNENLAESFFSRVRRGEYGVHHGFRPMYMAFYVHEYAWRETHRRRTQREKVKQLASWLLAPGYSHYWRGYHGGNRRRHLRQPRPEIVMGSVDAPWQDARSTARKAPGQETS